jgi:hypothetical protein
MVGMPFKRFNPSINCFLSASELGLFNQKNTWCNKGFLAGLWPNAAPTKGLAAKNVLLFIIKGFECKYDDF